MKAKKIKSVAQGFVCQSKEQVAENIRTIGDNQREIARLEAEINDILAKATDERKDKILKLQQDIEVLSKGVQSWCEVHRSQLLENGLKTAQLVTGEVSWRLCPPSVQVRKKEEVVERLERMGLVHLVRTKKDVNKDAILDDPAQVLGVEGITIVSGKEEFIIKPHEVKGA